MTKVVPKDYWREALEEKIDQFVKLKVEKDEIEEKMSTLREEIISEMRKRQLKEIVTKNKNRVLLIIKSILTSDYEKIKEVVGPLWGVLARLVTKYEIDRKALENFYLQGKIDPEKYKALFTEEVQLRISSLE